MATYIKTSNTAWGVDREDTWGVAAGGGHMGCTWQPGEDTWGVRGRTI